MTNTFELIMVKMNLPEAMVFTLMALKISGVSPRDDLLNLMVSKNTLNYT